MARPLGIDIASLDRERLETMAEAGREVVECHRVLAKAGQNIVGELLPKEGAFYQFDHCPPGDVYDRDSHAQYYYHAHRDAEHGHFHTFLREAGMPKGIQPLAPSAAATVEGRQDRLSHLIAISMDRKGIAIGLFTTNRWVTGEDWYAAEYVIAMLDRFEIDQARPSWPTNRWIGAMLILFRPQIETLLHERDVAVAAWLESYPEENTFEDRRLEVTSQCGISVDDQRAAIEAALASQCQEPDNGRRAFRTMAQAPVRPAETGPGRDPSPARRIK